MKILKEYGITDKKQRYNMSVAPGRNMSELAGQRIDVKAYLLVEDTDPSTGEIKKALKVLAVDKDGSEQIVGTRSQSYINGFENFLTFMETDVCESMGIGQQRSKAGRSYLVFIA